ncbi:YciI family protein [Rossellomorea sp. YZS02]|uniref:YciI family protein n=1 Tax=Rossellomorea sp. YZS02 TaxID=3097358 RepID=UPI002A0EDE93|nr:YciI family protein [Rossellomorea sp. YZS02]MDX8344555.1 YciI family protein [Rossellomorea sp. YZS02]
MKFLCVGYYNAEKMDRKPKEEIDAIMAKCGPHLDAFFKSGQVMVDAGVEKGVKQLRRSGGQVVVEDTHERAEKIGSVFIIEAEELEDAIRVASLHPSVQVDEGEGFGWRLEVHPVHSYKGEMDEC